MKSFREFYANRNSEFTDGFGDAGELNEVVNTRVMETAADYMDYIVNQSIIGKLEEIRCCLIDIDTAIRDNNASKT